MTLPRMHCGTLTCRPAVSMTGKISWRTSRQAGGASRACFSKGGNLCTCPPATMWSSLPGQVGLSLLRRATHSSSPASVST